MIQECSKAAGVTAMGCNPDGGQVSIGAIISQWVAACAHIAKPVSSNFVLNILRILTHRTPKNGKSL